MTGVNTRVETLDVMPPRVVTLVAATGANVLPLRDDGKDWRYRYIQNLTGADLYYAIDIDSAQVSADFYHGVLPDKAQLNVPCKGRVSCFSVGGGKVATLELYKMDA